MKNKKAEELLKKYIENSATQSEQLTIEKWYEQLSVPADPFDTEEARTQQLDYIKGLLPGAPKKKTIPMWYKIAAAACLILVSGIVIYLSNNGSHNPTKPMAVADIVPGKNTATLTLADGKEISLTTAANGKIADQSGVVISKTAQGELIYTLSEAGESERPDPNKLNEIKTPNGGQYRVILPDGSKVWMNAASSLKYPPVFSKHDRIIELSGEAYFEVAHDPSRPFKVKTNSQMVQVLGTHFNIKTYSTDELSKTTLIQGSVRVENKHNKTVYTLKPGQEYSINERTGSNMVSAANIASAIAWKDGYFSFEDQDLKTVMQTISRWYDVEIIYEHKAPNIAFEEGRISRSKSIKEVLEILELTGGVSFKITGRRITVM